MRSKSSLQAYILEAIGEPESIGAGADVMRGILSGLATIYDAGLEAYLLAERVGLRRREHLPVPIISIGNLTVGGTGKTPMTYRMTMAGCCFQPKMPGMSLFCWPALCPACRYWWAKIGGFRDGKPCDYLTWTRLF
jgi:hypothetical protein